MLHHIKEAEVIDLFDVSGAYSTKSILRSGKEVPLEISNPASNHYKVAESVNQFLGISSRL